MQDATMSAASRPFAHLHCHSHYSLLDGANRIPELVQSVKDRGMNAVAITDHGNLYGALEFYQECRAKAVNPLIGYEAYVAPTSRTEREARKRGDAGFHLTVLAKNETGFKNLIKLSSLAFLEGYHYVPRIDKEALLAHREGLVVLSGCASSEFSELILKEQMNEARQLAGWFAKHFKDNFFVEIQNNGLDIQRLCMEGAVDVADKLGLPLVATSDAHYLSSEDWQAHDVLLCINTGKLLSDPNRIRYGSREFHVRGPEEMYSLFPGHEAAVKRSQEIADSIDINLDLKKRHFPVYLPPQGKSPEQYLRDLCAEGISDRYGETVPGSVRERMEHELSIICRMGFASYFLVVRDFVRFAEEKGIPCGARGSACGALVSYVLKLSHVCPLEYDLLFERFLDPNRAEAPDIDIDFCKERRDEVIAYVRQRYGEASVAQIGTFGTMAAKAAIKDVGRVYDLPLEKVNLLTSFVPDRPGVTLEEALEESPDLRRARDESGDVARVLEIALKLEGTNRNVGTHAAGVVISNGPLVDYVPLQRVVRKGEDGQAGQPAITTQWVMGDLEKAGLLKMDFLGLRTLTMLENALRMIERNHGKKIDLRKLPLNDPDVYKLLQRGDAKGVFQLEGNGIRELLKKLKPDNIRDIIALMALYRPGPLEGGMVDSYVNRKHGREKPTYAHPVMKEVLEETYGVMVYQEQIMRILNRLGGIELSSAYACIKAISKKKYDIIDKRKEEFIQGAIERGLAQQIAEDIFQLIVVFGGYGFNKSHTAAYAMVGYQTAYLKAHFLPEFMAALLSSEIEDGNKRDVMVDHIAEARKSGVEVLQPNVNSSEVEFDAREGRISFGLLAIKGVGRAAAMEIVRARREGGRFKDLFDLAERVDPKLVPKAALEKLTKAGALDSLGGHRAQVMMAISSAVQAAQEKQADKKIGQKGLFEAQEVTDTGAGGELASLPDVPKWPESEKLRQEKEVLDFYFSSHPLASQERELRRFATHTIGQFSSMGSDEEVIVGGLLVNLRSSNTKKARNGNSRFLRFRLEDMSGGIDCVIWPDDLARHKEDPKPDTVYYIKGRLERRGEAPSLIVSRILDLELARKELARALFIRVSIDRHDSADLDLVARALRKAPGPLGVTLKIEDGFGKGCAMKLGNGFTINPQKVPMEELESILGQDNVRLA